MASDQFSFRPQLEAWENPPAEQAPEPEPPARDPAAEAAASGKRMRYITAYLKDPKSHPSFADPAMVYRVLSEEHVYQQQQEAHLATELQRLPPSAESLGLRPEDIGDPEYDGLEERRAAMQRDLATSRKRQGQLYALMKQLVGTGT